MTQAPATPELVEKLRSRKEYLLGGPRRLMNLCEQAADALEAQQARIAELEVERDDLQRMYRHWAMIADQRLGASNRSLHRARDLQALADRYEKALRLAERELSFAVERMDRRGGSYEAALTEVRQALSSQGRHEGGEDGLQELPGVNAVPLPASPDGPSQIDRVWAAINVLGAPDTACTTDEDRAYCRAIGDALSEIEKLGGRPQ